MDERKWRQATEQDVGMWARYVVDGDVAFHGHFESLDGDWATLSAHLSYGGVRRDEVRLERVEVSE